MLLTHNIHRMGRRLINISERLFFLLSPLFPYIPLDTCLISSERFHHRHTTPPKSDGFFRYCISGRFAFALHFTEDKDTDSLAASSSRALELSSSSCFV